MSFTIKPINAILKKDHDTFTKMVILSIYYLGPICKTYHWIKNL